MSEELKMEGLSDEQLKDVAGGCDCGLVEEKPWATVTGLTSGYLAVRSAKEYKDENILGGLKNGDKVQIMEPIGPGYTYVYAICKPMSDGGNYTSKGYTGYGFVKSEFIKLPY